MSGNKDENMGSLERLILKIFYHCQYGNGSVLFNAVRSVGVGVDYYALAVLFTVKNAPEGFGLCVLFDFRFKSKGSC